MDVNLKGYDVDQDEVLVAFANTDLFEQLEVGDRSSNNSEMGNLGKVTDNKIEVPTPLKGEKSFKRHSGETEDMDVDLVTKKPRMPIQNQEVVGIDDDDERSINKGKATIVEEESHDQSQLVSNTKRTITNPAIVESTQDPTWFFKNLH